MSEQFNDGESVAETPQLKPALQVGEILRLAREAQGVTALEIAHTLKLAPRQVAALEAGDWQGLPGNTFVRGFVRNYARIVQVDAAPLMAQLDGSLEKENSNLAVSEMSPATMPRSGAAARRDRTLAMMGIGLVVLAALVYFLLPNNLSTWRESTQGLLDSLARKEEPVPTAVIPAEPLFPPGTTPQQIMNPQVPVSTDALPGDVVAPVPGVRVLPAPADVTPVAATPVAAIKAPQLRFVVHKDSWLEVRDRDNKPIFSQRVLAGTEQTLTGEGPLSMVIGFAPGVRVFSHGQAVDLTPHTRGEVARLVLE